MNVIMLDISEVMHLISEAVPAGSAFHFHRKSCMCDSLLHHYAQVMHKIKTDKSRFLLTLHSKLWVICMPKLFKNVLILVETQVPIFNFHKKNCPIFYQTLWRHSHLDSLWFPHSSSMLVRFTCANYISANYTAVVKRQVAVVNIITKKCH